jgi:acyl-CoA synthetase (AMP-forming)/AMP-acid ligase II
MGLSSHSRAVGAGLASLKFSAKDTILVVLPNNIDRLVLQLAASYAGCNVATVEDYAADVDIHACIKASKARAVFVTTAFTTKVRAAVPELVLAGSTREKNPRHFQGNAMENAPIGSLDFPHLKHVFHTGTSREPRFHLFKHLPLYFPVPSPLTTVQPMPEDAPFFKVLSTTGDVIHSASRNDLLSQGSKIANSLKLKADENVMLCTKGDPLSTMVGLVACMGSWSQLVVPNPKEEAGAENFADIERITAAIGSDLPVPKGAGQRVAKL